jgi:Uma2 family endonuclease
VTDDRTDVVPDPAAVFEVASPGTEKVDGGRKMLRYVRIPSLRHYVLIDQDEALVVVYSRHDESWPALGLEGLEATLELTAIGMSIPLAAIYEGVTFPEP